MSCNAAQQSRDTPRALLIPVECIAATFFSRECENSSGVEKTSTKCMRWPVSDPLLHLPSVIATAGCSSLTTEIREDAAVAVMSQAARSWLARRRVEKIRREEFQSRAIRSKAALSVQVCAQVRSQWPVHKWSDAVHLVLLILGKGGSFYRCSFRGGCSVLSCIGGVTLHCGVPVHMRGVLPPEGFTPNTARKHSRVIARGSLR